MTNGQVGGGRPEITATAKAISEAVPRWDDPAQVAALSQVRELLADPGSDDGPKRAAVATLLTVCRCWWCSMTLSRI